MNTHFHQFAPGKIAGVLLVCLGTAIPVLSLTATVRSTTNAARWVDNGSVTSTSWSATANYLEIIPDSQYQIIEGWGGCFGERGWQAMKVLSQAGRDSVMRALFDTSGCKFTYCRTPLGSNDYIIAPTIHPTLDDSAGDYDLTAFSIAQDKLYLIPYIKAAIVYQPGLRLWAIPWNCPNWLISGMQNQVAKDMTTYAEYFKKYVLAYKAEGLNVVAVGLHNEPDINPGTPWNDGGTYGSGGQREAYWTRNYLGPLFAKDLPGVEMWLADYWHPDHLDNYIKPALNDAEANKYLSVVGVQSNHADWGTVIHTSYPSKRFIQCEAPPDDNSATWGIGMNKFNNMYSYFSQWCNAYMQWNMVLDETGSSNDGWLQGAMVHITQSAKRVNYTPHFYAVKHYSYYVAPNARHIKTVDNAGFSGNKIAFRNPDGGVVLVFANTSGSAAQLTIKLGDQKFQASVPATSMNTISIKQAAVAAKPAPVAVNAARPMTNGIFKVTNNRFRVPQALAGKSLSIAVYDCAGKIVRKSVIIGNDGQRDANIGAADGVYLVHVAANVAGRQ